MRIKGFGSFLNVFVRQVRTNTFSWLAFASLLAWMFGLYWSNLFFDRVVAGSFDFLQMRSLWLAAEAVALLAVLCLLGLAKGRSGSTAVAGGCTFAGTVMLLFLPADADGLRLVGILLTGFGSAVLLVGLGMKFARLGPQALLVNVALALLVASLLDSLLLVLPGEVQSMAVALMPVVCIVFLVFGQRGPHDLSDVPCERDASSRSRRGFVVRVIALPLAVGLSYGLMQRLTAGSYVLTSVEANAATILSFFVSAVFIGLAALFFEPARLTKLVCFAAIPLIGIAFVMLPLFESAREAAQSICIVGFNSFYFMVWALWADGREGDALEKRFALGLFVLVAAESMGSVLGLSIIGVLGESGQALAVVSLIVVYLLLMAGIFSFSRSEGARSQQPEAFSAKREPLMPGLADRELVLEAWATRYGLSARETEVFALLAKGRNRAAISKALFVSDNTTRTHMKSIYRKLGIHSHQELIDLLEQQEGKSGE
ncbi:helix-turn-helix transcriptional regulator [Gordonibacter sp.]|uniref:helix-turn-helix transcriptional regulator n=1 Tax=Gordonibacter sp. TaxID=1968902 RepID=UPI002FC7372A